MTQLAPLRLIEVPGEDADIEDLKVGDCWYADPDALDPQGYKFWHSRVAHRSKLSEAYRATWEHIRKPLCVVLPGRMIFCVDSMCYSGERGYYGGWTVTGDHTNMTVSPSINVGGTYHGWITNGWVLNDIDGHAYDEHWDRCMKAKAPQ